MSATQAIIQAILQCPAFSSQFGFNDTQMAQLKLFCQPNFLELVQKASQTIAKRTERLNILLLIQGTAADKHPDVQELHAKLFAARQELIYAIKVVDITTIVLDTRGKDLAKEPESEEKELKGWRLHLRCLESVRALYYAHKKVNVVGLGLWKARRDHGA